MSVVVVLLLASAPASGGLTVSWRACISSEREAEIIQSRGVHV